MSSCSSLMLVTKTRMPYRRGGVVRCFSGASSFLQLFNHSTCWGHDFDCFGGLFKSENGVVSL